MLMEYVDFGDVTPPPPPNDQVDQAEHEDTEQGRDEVEKVGEGGPRSGNGRRATSELVSRRSSSELRREMQGDLCGPTHDEWNRRAAVKVRVLHALSSTWLDHEGACTIGDWHSEVVGGVEETVVAIGIRKACLSAHVKSRRRVAAARSRDVAKGRGGQGRRVGEEVTPHGVAEVALDGSATRLESEVDLSVRCDRPCAFVGSPW